MSDKRSPLVPHQTGVAGRTSAETERFVKRSESVDHTHGVRLEGIEMPAGEVITIAHKLGRVPYGYWPTRVRVGPAKYHEHQPSDSKYLYLYSESTSTIDWWVF